MSYISEFVKSRDEAFADFVLTNNKQKLLSHFSRYGQRVPKDERILKAGVYKAVQECEGIPEDVKRVARQKCIELGFSPCFTEVRNDNIKAYKSHV